MEVEKEGREVGDVAVLDILGGDTSLDCLVLKKLWSYGS